MAQYLLLPLIEEVFVNIFVIYTEVVETLGEHYIQGVGHSAVTVIFPPQ